MEGNEQFPHSFHSYILLVASPAAMRQSAEVVF